MDSQYVKALYEFSTSQSGEISLVPGDVVQVDGQIDENWLTGTLLRGGSGSFPVNFVEPLELPTSSLPPHNKIFAAAKVFDTNVDGDLVFRKGDVVIGEQQIDANWWFGSCGDAQGIFPVTHVTQLNVLPPSNNNKQRQLSSASQGKAPPPDSTSCDGEIAVGRANMDLTAQLEDELDFIKGDIVHIIKVLDDGFALGKCGGKTGSFPLCFVDITEGSLEKKKEEDPKERRSSKFGWWKEEEGTNNVAMDDEYFNVNAVPCNPEPEICDMPQVDTPALPPTNDQVVPMDVVPVQTTEAHRRTSSYTSLNTRSCDSELTPYGKTLFPFIAENDNELTFFGNEIITLVCHVDDQWLEGEIDGKRGICPRSYVDIIVDCPNAEELGFRAESTTVDVAPAQAAEDFQDVYGRVMYDFQAVSENDLNLAEGDTVTILRKADEHWFEAQHDDGRRGLVPVSYIELISEEAMLSPTKDVQSESKPPSESPSQMETRTPSPPMASTEEPIAKPVTASVPDVVKEAEEKPKSVEVPTVTKPVKPALKPKPQLKPKPSLKGKLSTDKSSDSQVEKEKDPPRDEPDTISPDSAQVAKSENTVPESQDTDEVDAIWKKNLITPMPPEDRKSPLTVKAVETNQLPKQPPQQDSGKLAPARPSKGPPSKSSSCSLDELISNELKQAKASTTDPAKPPPPQIIVNKPQKKLSLNEMANAQRMAKINQQHLSVGQSLFYAQDAEPKTCPSRPPLPSSNRPVQFPVSFDDDVDEAQVESPPVPGLPPPRPSAPRPAPRNHVEAKPVPQRKAPPRPTGPAARMPYGAKEPGFMLIDFSPEKAASFEDDVSEENREVIADLERRLQEIEADIQKYEKLQADLKDMLAIAGEKEAISIQEDLDFYSANIKGFRQERSQIKESLYELQPSRAMADLASQQIAAEQLRRKEEEEKQREEGKKKRIETRQKVIAEVLATEKDFLWSLHLFVDSFMAHRNEKCPVPDDVMDTLFGNLDEVIEVSQCLLNELEAATAGKTFENQLIGPCFMKLKDDMKKVYAVYCRNHDDVIALLEKAEDDPEIQDFFNRMLENMRRQGSVFDIGSLLIKPVQRILKYPLLLNELIKSTEETHADKCHLVDAVNGMTDVAAAINEFKRRKDLVTRYKKDRDDTLSDKFAKLNVHSTMKKFYRLSRKVVGVQMTDEQFNIEEKRFRALDSAVKTLVRDISQYMEQLQHSVSAQEALANDVADFYGEKELDQVDKFCKVHNVVASSLLEKFKSSVETCVIGPLNRLLLMFQGPTKIIKKRHDKLLDYDNLSARMKGLKENEEQVVKQDLRMARANYEALNAQLLDELPKLYVLSLEVVQDCLNKFVRSEEQFHQSALEQMYQLMGLDLVLASDSNSIIEPFNIAHVAAVERLSALSFVTRAFNPQLEETRKSRGSRRSIDHKPGTPVNELVEENSTKQSPSQQASLRQKYPPEKLFTAPNAVAATGQMMDLSLAAGTLVGVIKEGDPMGNKDRWFVDTGAAKGFVLKSHFVPFSEAESSPKSGRSSVSSVKDLMDFSPEKSPSQSQSRQGTSPLHLEVTPRNSPSSVHNSSFTSQPSPSLPRSPRVPDTPDPSLQDDIDDYDDCQLPTDKDLEEFYQAIYPFQARNELELSINEGDVVHVIQQQDQEGNSDWWLVEAYGKKGYVPATYIYKVE